MTFVPAFKQIQFWNPSTPFVPREVSRAPRRGARPSYIEALTYRNRFVATRNTGFSRVTVQMLLRSQ